MFAFLSKVLSTLIANKEILKNNTNEINILNLVLVFLDFYSDIIRYSISFLLYKNWVEYE